MTRDDKAKELIKQYCKAEITGKQFCDAVDELYEASNGAKPFVSGSLPPDEFADMLLRDFEISTFDNGDLCWQLAGTKQKYTSAEIYKKLGGNDR